VTGSLQSKIALNTSVFTWIGTSSPDWMNAVMQDDGNFVVYFVQGHPSGHYNGFAKWATGTNGHGVPPWHITLQADGNLVLTDGSGAEQWRAPRVDQHGAYSSA